MFQLFQISQLFCCSIFVTVSATFFTWFSLFQPLKTSTLIHTISVSMFYILFQTLSKLLFNHILISTKHTVLLLLVLWLGLFWLDQNFLLPLTSRAMKWLCFFFVFFSSFTESVNISFKSK